MAKRKKPERIGQSGEKAAQKRALFLDAMTKLKAVTKPAQAIAIAAKVPGVSKDALTHMREQLKDGTLDPGRISGLIRMRCSNLIRGAFNRAAKEKAVKPVVKKKKKPAKSSFARDVKRADAAIKDNVAVGDDD